MIKFLILFILTCNVNILSELINISVLGVKSDIHFDSLPSTITQGLINLQSG